MIQEHAILAKTQGVNKLVVVVNKMDDPTVNWSEERYKECTSKLTVFLKGVGYNPKTDLAFMPISAQTSKFLYNHNSREPREVEGRRQESEGDVETGQERRKDWHLCIPLHQSSKLPIPSHSSGSSV